MDGTLEMLRNSTDLPENLEIARSVEPGLSLFMDPDHLQQVLWNLFLNAVEVMPQGGQLDVEAQAVAGWPKGFGPKRVVEIKVSDTGPGIEEGRREKIFEPFYTTKGRGTGLGLAIVHRIVESYGGRIAASGNTQNGATFTLLIPHQERPEGPGDSLSGG
jgi:signal transduction histidine kinase